MQSGLHKGTNNCHCLTAVAGTATMPTKTNLPKKGLKAKLSSVAPSTTNGSRRNPDDVLASAQVQHENGRQDNSTSVFIDSSTAPTKIIVNASGVTQSQSTGVSCGNLTTSSDSSQHRTSAEQSVPTDIATVVDQPPVQPRLRFLITVVGMKKRSFNLDWYRLYHWLEYSRERDAAYWMCAVCLLHNLVTIVKRFEEMVSDTGNMHWVARKEFSHVMTAAILMNKPCLLGRIT